MEADNVFFLKERFPAVSIKENAVFVPFQSFLPLMEFLHGQGFDFLYDYTAVDWPDRFALICEVRSYSTLDRLAVKTDIAKENPEVPSLTSLWDSANWLEREIYDMFGIKFKGHPNLRRILLEEGYDGYPLRKDYKEGGSK